MSWTVLQFKLLYDAVLQTKGFSVSCAIWHCNQNNLTTHQHKGRVFHILTVYTVYIFISNEKAESTSFLNRAYERPRPTGQGQWKFCWACRFETPRPDLPVHFLNFQKPWLYRPGPGLLKVSLALACWPWSFILWIDWLTERNRNSHTSEIGHCFATNNMFVFLQTMMSIK